MHIIMNMGGNKLIGLMHKWMNTIWRERKECDEYRNRKEYDKYGYERIYEDGTWYIECNMINMHVIE